MPSGKGTYGSKKGRPPKNQEKMMGMIILPPKKPKKKPK